MDSRPSIVERVVMAAIQQWEAGCVRSDPDAGEELVAAGVA